MRNGSFCSLGLVLLSFFLVACEQPPAFDCIIDNGVIIDGTGGAGVDGAVSRRGALRFESRGPVRRGAALGGAGVRGESVRVGRGARRSGAGRFGVSRLGLSVDRLGDERLGAACLGAGAERFGEACFGFDERLGCGCTQSGAAPSFVNPTSVSRV